MTSLPLTKNSMKKPALRFASDGFAAHTITRLLAIVASACMLLIIQPAVADEFADVTRLLRSGQTAEALVRIDAFLQKNPRDMQMRFVKGVVLTEQGKMGDAIAVFTKLTEDHPDLPEPYNNLAVLFAASGQYEKARTALDMAIRTNPSYATAYENLGDVHAKLASQAYDKALQLDSGNTNAKSKLTLLRTVGSTVAANDAGTKGSKEGSRAMAAAAVPKQAPVPTPAPVVPKAVVAATTPVPVPKAIVMPPPPAIAIAKTNIADEMSKVRFEAKPKTDVAPEIKPGPPLESRLYARADSRIDFKPEPKADVKPIAFKPEAKTDGKIMPVSLPGTAENSEILATVNDWAEAWSAQDVKRYLAHYGNDFETPNGESRKAWEDGRTSRIAGKGRISVKVGAPQVSINGSQATVKFRQLYASDQLQADSKKTLMLIKQNGKWQIKQERTGA